MTSADRSTETELGRSVYTPAVCPSEIETMPALMTNVTAPSAPAAQHDQLLLASSSLLQDARIRTPVKSDAAPPHPYNDGAQLLLAPFRYQVVPCSSRFPSPCGYGTGWTA